MTTPKHRWLFVVAFILAASTALALGLINSGIFDPTPIGRIKSSEALIPMTLAPQTRQISWLKNKLPDSPYSIRLTAALKEGEPDSAYGLTFGDNNAYFSVTVSPLGYLAVWGKGSVDVFYLNWQTWPHVKKGQEKNEIWVDIAAEHATVRVNRELLWQGEIDPVSQRIGLIGETFGQASTIDFESIEIFSDLYE